MLSGHAIHIPSDPAKKAEVIRILDELERRKGMRKLFTMYPEAGALRRELYPRHMEFFRAGAQYRERSFMAANRVGKTEGAGGYEMTLHLTGLYPDWWEGRRFEHPISAWAAGKTNETTRDIIQRKMLGAPGKHGTGLIPGECIIGTTPRSGIPEAVDTVRVKHVSGGVSELGFKSYKQGRDGFEGTEKHVIWPDEEPPLDIYNECLIRTMTCNGMMMSTFTPLEGITDVVLMFLPGGKVADDSAHIPDQAVGASRFLVMAGWDDVPHLTSEAKAELLASTPEYLREARSKGIPRLGSGAIYPVAEEFIAVDDFAVPDHWPRVFSLDVGWRCTAALWGAWDRQSDIVYLYSAHKAGQSEPPVHAAAIKGRGVWIPGVSDPAASGSSQIDGRRLIDEYRKQGIELYEAENSVEAGIYAVWERMCTGRLKVFKSLVPWFEEFRLYRRDDRGKVVKENDHLMDDTRYLVVSGLAVAKCKPVAAKPAIHRPAFSGQHAGAGWMGN